MAEVSGLELKSFAVMDASVCCLLSFQSFAGTVPRGLQRSCICLTAVRFHNEALMVNDHASSCCIRLSVNLMAGAF